MDILQMVVQKVRAEQGKKAGWYNLQSEHHFQNLVLRAAEHIK